MIQEGLAKPFQLGKEVLFEDSSTRRRVLDAMRDGKRGVEEIAAESGLTIAEVLSELRQVQSERGPAPMFIQAS